MSKKNFYFCLLTGLFLFITFSNVYSQNIPTDSLKKVELNECEIIVNSLSKDAVNSSSIIGSEDIRNKIGNGSVNNIFDQVPSMVTTSDAGTGLGYSYMRIRGIDQTRINVTINGIALNDAESQGSWFVNLPDFGSHVGELTVQRGVGASNCGAAAFGSSMNFSTLLPSLRPMAEVSSSFGSYNTFRNMVTASTGLIKDFVACTVGYSNIQSDGYMENSTANLNSLFFNTFIKLPAKQFNRSDLTFNVLYGQEKTGLAWNGTPSDSLSTNRKYNSCGMYYDKEGILHHYYNETDNYTQTHYQLFYHYVNNKHRLSLKIGTHFTRGLGYYEEYKDDKSFAKYGFLPIMNQGDTIFESDFITRKYLDNYFYGVTFDLSSNQGWKGNRNMFVWRIIGGVNNYNGKHYGNVIWAQDNSTIEPNYRWYYGTGDKLQGNVALQGNLILNQKMRVSLDMQYRLIHYKIGGTDDLLQDIFQEYNWHFFNPKAFFLYDITQETKRNHKLKHSLYASFAMANREPTRSDIVDAQLGSKPKPETLFDVELGYELDNDENFHFNANGYFMYYIDQLILTGKINDVGAAIMSNVDRSYRLGIELVSNYRPVKYFAWKINGTFSINRIMQYTHYTEKYDADWNFIGMNEETLGNSTISFSPNIILTNEFLFTPIERFNIGLVTKFVGKQYIDNSQDNTHVLKPYSVTNLNFSYDFASISVRANKNDAKVAIGVFFNVNNIFNAKYSSNAWLYRYYLDNELAYSDGYFPQATINVVGGIKVRF